MKDETARLKKRADRINAKAAEQAPLLALMGAIPQVTADDLAARKDSALRHHEQRLANEAIKIEQLRAELIGVVGQERYDEFVAHNKIGEPGYMPWYIGLAGGLQRARQGQPLIEPYTFGIATPRTPGIDSQAVVAFISQWPKGCTAAEIADALAAHILDVAYMAMALAEIGRIRLRPGGGYLASG